jgi:CRP-like cAMP-binding protein
MPGITAGTVELGEEFKSSRGRSKLASRLAEHPFMIGLDPQFVKLISRGAKERNYDRGETLFLAGEPADTFYLVVFGAVSLEFAIREERRSSIQTVVSGEVVGWSWMTPPYRWTSDARALSATRVIVLDAANIRRVCDARPADGYRLMLRLTDVIANRLDNARSLLAEQYDRPPVR